MLKDLEVASYIKTFGHHTIHEFASNRSIDPNGVDDNSITAGEGTASLLQFSHSVVSDPMYCSMPSFPVHHKLPKFTQIHVH